MPTIGLLDSGVGGLSVLSVVRRELPWADCLYFADSLHMPYGSRKPEDVRRLVASICNFLVKKDCSIIVMACNTASALALEAVREASPVPVLGVIQPGARAAVRVSRNGRIGVVATEGTTRSQAYVSAIHKIKPEALIYSQACPRLAALVEQGATHTAEVRDDLALYLAPLLANGIDTLVLGCTHYAMMANTIRSLLPPEVDLVDPAEETVEELKAIVAANMWGSGGGAGSHKFFVTGSPGRFAEVAQRLLSWCLEASSIHVVKEGSKKGTLLEVE